MNYDIFTTVIINVFIIGLGLAIVKFYVEQMLRDICVKFNEKIMWVNDNIKLILTKVEKIEERLNVLEKNSVKTQTDINYLQRRINEWEEKE